jgi:hypothetical protein
VEYPLSISRLVETTREGERRTPVICVMAKAELGPFADFGSPEFFFGRLAEVSDDTIQYLKHAPGVEVVFRGAAYRFEALEPSAVFKLVRRP